MWVGSGGSDREGGPVVRTVDAVVIGAGHNGLVAANLLADAGWDVLVLEASRHAGGAVRTRRADRSRLPSATCTAPSTRWAPRRRCCAELDLERTGCLAQAPAVLAHVLPDDRCVVLSRDVDETAASVATFAGATARRGPPRCGAGSGSARRCSTRCSRPFPPVRAGARLRPRLGPAGALRLRAAIGAAGPAVRPRRSSTATAPGCCSPATRCTPTWARSSAGSGAVRVAAGHARPGHRVSRAGRRRGRAGRGAGAPARTAGGTRRVRPAGSQGADARATRSASRTHTANGAGPPRRAGRRAAPALYTRPRRAGRAALGFVADLRRFQWDNSHDQGGLGALGAGPLDGGRRAPGRHRPPGRDLDGLTAYTAALARAGCRSSRSSWSDR